MTSQQKNPLNRQFPNAIILPVPWEWEPDPSSRLLPRHTPRRPAVPVGGPGSPGLGSALKDGALTNPEQLHHSCYIPGRAWEPRAGHWRRSTHKSRALKSMAATSQGGPGSPGPACVSTNRQCLFGRSLSWEEGSPGWFFFLDLPQA